jgi:hypothetical protein
MFQQVRKTGKRNCRSSVCERLVSHSPPVPTLTCLRDGPKAREAHVGSRPKWQMIRDRNLESKPYRVLRKLAVWIIENRTSSFIFPQGSQSALAAQVSLADYALFTRRFIACADSL